MELNGMQTALFGFLSGLTEILPISARAHSALLLKLFGAQSADGLQSFFIHFGMLAAVFLSSRSIIDRISRARNLARIPKKRRKRPLDAKSLMDYSFLKTMLLPVILAFLLYSQLRSWHVSLLVLAAMMFLNGIILYIPQFFPSSNKDSRSLTRLEGLVMGLGGGLSILPGFSGLGAALSIGSVCGVERSYALDMGLLMELAICLLWTVYDVLAVIGYGVSGFSAAYLGQCLALAATAFAGGFLGVRIMRGLSARMGYSIFAFYCWGIAIFAFILNLMA